MAVGMRGVIAEMIATMTVAVAAVMPTVWAFGAALVVVGFASISMMATANAYVQTSTAPAMRGRVMALYVAIFFGGTIQCRVDEFIL